MLRRQTGSRKAPASRAVWRCASSSAEVFARKVVEANGKPTMAVVRRALALVDIPCNTTRRNVMPRGVSKIRGAVCGLYVFRDKTGLSSFSRNNPWLTKLLAAFCRAAQPSFRFTSIQVNKNYASRPHVDRNNLGESFIVALGNFKGGSLWIHDDEGKIPHTLAESISHEPMYKKGATCMGRDINIRGKWQQFDGNRLHFTRCFRGQRFSLVYYTCDRYAEVPAAVRDEVRTAGFNFSWASPKLQKMLITKKVVRKQANAKINYEINTMHRGIVSQLVDNDRVRYVQKNPKLAGCAAYKLYEKYKRSKTVGEAVRRGARPIDLIFDYNKGYLKVDRLETRPAHWDMEMDTPVSSSSSSGVGTRPTAEQSRGAVKVRVAEMNLGHKGIDVPWAALRRLAALVPTLHQLPAERWAAKDGPFASMPLAVVRVLLHWASTGRLRYERAKANALRDALAGLGMAQLALLVMPKRALPTKTPA